MKEGFIEILGLRIHYAESGTGLPLVYVHGNLGSLRWWEKVMEIPGARTLALDLPNFGGSGALPGEADIESYADYLLAFIEALGLDRPLLVGHSLGGAVVLALAARRPALPRGLLLVDPAPPSGLLTSPARYPAIEAMRENPAILEKALRGVVPSIKDEAYFRALVEDARRMAAPAWIGNASALGRMAYGPALGAFTAPVLVLRGELDYLVSEAMARETQAAFPRARLETLSGLGHSVNAEDPARFRAILEAFQASLLAGSEGVAQ